ncbi:MAG: methyltransferase domain-containing protein, partial [Thermoanaerobaculia bacterium]|nr:methyltransferase domain-containing protein [Thermoanaerobaculia bacterium]
CMPRNVPDARPLAVLLLATAFAVPTALPAQEESLRPGINKVFSERELDRWIEMFEGEDRDVYTRRDEVLEIVGLEPGMDVADVGAGTGFFTMLFAREVAPGGTAYGLDITQQFVDHIVTQAAELGLDNVVGLRNEADSMSLPADSVDVVFMCDTYHHFEYPYRMLASIREVLRPGGRVVVVDLERVEGVTKPFVLNMVRAGKGTFTDEFRNAGFDLVEDISFSPEDYILIFEEREPAGTASR